MSFRFPFLILIVLVVSFTTFAFASSQTGQPSGGEGMSPVSGWTVSNVHYQLANDSSTLVGVEFDLDGPAGVVKASVNSSGTKFFDCRNTGAYHWVCYINSSIQVSELDELRIVATGG